MVFTPWAAGQRITAARLAAMTLTWSAWTPTWSTSTGVNTPSFGNATIDCKYAQSADAVFFEFEITMGSTTSFGGGGSADNWRFSLPVTAAETVLIAGMGEIQDAVATTRWPIRARLTTTTTIEVELCGRAYDDTAGVSSGLVDATTPMTWANTDRLLLHGHYQAA